MPLSGGHWCTTAEGGSTRNLNTRFLVRHQWMSKTEKFSNRLSMPFQKYGTNY